MQYRVTTYQGIKDHVISLQWHVVASSATLLPYNDILFLFKDTLLSADKVTRKKKFMITFDIQC